jgi:hypothetical protein
MQVSKLGGGELPPGDILGRCASFTSPRFPARRSVPRSWTPGISMLATLLSTLACNVSATPTDTGGTAVPASSCG